MASRARAICSATSFRISPIAFLDVKPVRVFRFDEIREAHCVMEANEARGKMVVVQE